MFVRPAMDPEREGQRLKVRVPHSHELLPDGGREVPETGDWLRYLRDKDVEICEPPAEGDHPAEPAAIEEQPA